MYIYSYVCLTVRVRATAFFCSLEIAVAVVRIGS